jgi:P27 family predicted phage terminase small subunit
MPRYRTSDASKRLAGTYRSDRAKRRPSVNGLVTVPAAPDHLTELARKEWHRLAPLVAEQRTLTQADLRGFELLCDTLASAAQAQEVIAREGMTITGDGGKIRAHPAVKILEAARAQATRLLIEYGLTPRARGHVEPAADTTPHNPFADLA